MSNLNSTPESKIVGKASFALRRLEDSPLSDRETMLACLLEEARNMIALRVPGEWLAMGDSVIRIRARERREEPTTERGEGLISDEMVAGALDEAGITCVSRH